MVKTIHDHLLELMEEGKKYATSEIYNLIKNKEVSRISVNKIMSQLMKHNPWRDNIYIEKRVETFEKGVTFVWIKIKKEKK